jgi:hypothetical protein
MDWNRIEGNWKQFTGNEGAVLALDLVARSENVDGYRILSDELAAGSCGWPCRCWSCACPPIGPTPQALSGSPRHSLHWGDQLGPRRDASH